MNLPYAARITAIHPPCLIEVSIFDSTGAKLSSSAIELPVDPTQPIDPDSLAAGSQINAVIEFATRLRARQMIEDAGRSFTVLLGAMIEHQVDL